MSLCEMPAYSSIKNGKNEIKSLENSYEEDPELKTIPCRKRLRKMKLIFFFNLLCPPLIGSY